MILDKGIGLEAGLASEADAALLAEREAGHHTYFRVVDFAVIGNHIHLIVEADGAEALAVGMHALEVRLARRLNRHFGRRGKLFADR